MASTSETGHAKNVANFDVLISSVAACGALYNPSKAAIRLEALQALSDSAKEAIGAVNEACQDHRIAATNRKTAFAGLNKLVTRAINALKISEDNIHGEKNARALVRKIQGVRAKAKMTVEEKQAAAAAGKEVVEISASQMSYDGRLANFAKFVSLLASVAQYHPNETDLTVAALTGLCNDLQASTTAVVTAAARLGNARIARNKLLYQPSTGMVGLALGTKSYIKSVYGATSPHYRQVSKLLFKKPYN
jgi:hypothetical protein